MQIATSLVTNVSLTKSADEWRQVLVDPHKFQDELREALAGIVRETDAPGKAFSIQDNRPLPAGSIETAARKQNKRFLEKRGKRATKATSTAGKVPCPKCGKPVKDTPKGWGVHNAKAIKSGAHPAVSTADAP